MADSSSRTKAFISYSHKDKRFLDELHTHLAYFERQGLVEFWDDQKLVPGMPWEDSIKQAIKSAKVAILLVSPSFLASEFINSQELPPLVEAAQNEGAVLLSVIVRFCQFKHSVLAPFQTVNNLSEPLIDIKPGKRDRVWARVVELVSNALSKQEIQGHQKQPSPPARRTAEQWVEEGIFSLKDEVYEEALFAFGKAIRLDPDNATAQNGRGIALSALQKHKEALGTFNHAIQLNPGRAYLYQNKGNALNELGRYEEALEAFDKAFQLNPNDVSIQIGRKIALKKIQINEGILYRVPQRQPPKPLPSPAKTVEEWLKEGISHGKAKHYTEALMAFDHAIHLNPNDAIAWQGKGMTLISLQCYQEAPIALDRAIQLNPNDALAYYHKGVALRKLQRYQDALDAYNHSIHLNPNYALAWRGRGIALKGLGRTAEAEQAFQRARELGYEEE